VRVSELFLVAALGLGMSSAACGGPSPARVEQGQPVSTGDADFDAFFKQVDEARTESMRADKDVAQARAALITALGLPADAGLDVTVKEAGDRAKKLKDESSVLLHLELTPEARLVSTKGKPLDDKGEATLKAVEEAAKSSIAVMQRLNKIAARVAELQSARRGLREKTRATFGGRAEEIERELDASEGVLARAAELGDKSAGLASQFVLALAGAVETGAAPGKAGALAGGPGRGKPAQGKAGGKAPGGKQGGAADRASGAGATAPASTGAGRKPKPKDDFEP
jgi:hypothetical protein